MSTPNQWYYVKDNERCGPVAPAQLKQLADAGEVQRDSLVWRVGMPNWVEAELVQGLFPPAAQPDTPSIAEPPSDAARPAPPAQQPQPQGQPQQPQPQQPQPQQPQPQQPYPQPQPATIQEVPAQEVLAQMVQTEPIRRVRVREKNFLSFHPTAMLLDSLRPLAKPSYVKASVRLFTQIGFWSIFAYVFILLVGSLIAAIKAEKFGWFGQMVGVSVLFILLQYVSVKMLDLLGAWKFESKVPRAFFDMVAVLALLLGVGSLVYLTIAALQTKTYMLVLVGIALFIVFAHFAKVALSLTTGKEDESEATDRSIAEEAQAVFGGLFLVTLRTVPVAFGTGIALAGLLLFYELTKLGDILFYGFFMLSSGFTITIVSYCLLLPLTAYLASVLLRVLGKLVVAVIEHCTKQS